MKKISEFVNRFAGITTNLIIVILILSCIASYRGKLFGMDIGDVVGNKKSAPHMGALQKHPFLDDGWSFYKKGIWRKVNASGAVSETVLFTEAHASDVNGYGGPVYLKIFLDLENKIQKVEIGENYETPVFLERVLKSDFLNRFETKILTAFKRSDYDTVTGATVSSLAILDAVAKTAESYKLILADKQVAKKKNTFNIVLTYKMLLSLLVIAFALILFLFFKGNKLFRTILLLMNVVILGGICGTMLSVQLFLNMISNGLNLSAGFVPLVLIALILILNLLNKKNFYCTWVCPFGSAQELLGKLSKKNITFPKKYQLVLNNLRNSLLLFLLFIGWIAGVTYVFDNSIFTVFLLNHAAPVVLVTASIVLVLSIFIKKCWCRFLCPTGALLNFIQTTK